MASDNNFFSTLFYFNYFPATTALAHLVLFVFFYAEELILIKEWNDSRIF